MKNMQKYEWNKSIYYARKLSGCKVKKMVQNAVFGTETTCFLCMFISDGEQNLRN